MTRPLTLGIDAANLRAGGGVTHLQGLLAAANLAETPFARVVVWGAQKTLESLPAVPWLDRRREPALEGSLPQRALWQRRALPHLARAACDVLLCPGGTAPPDAPRHVVMCRNMLPFERNESRRYWNTPHFVRLEALRYAQSRAFERADGVIFLTEYAESTVRPLLRALPTRAAIIPHGVDESLRQRPRPQRAIADCSPEDPFRVLYLSTIAPYKHPLTVVRAVAALRAQGLPITLELVGGVDHPTTLRNLRTTLRTLDPTGRVLVYSGPVEHRLVAQKLHHHDAFVFASSCENMPNILVEAMAAGLPIACSDRGPMPEVLGPHGMYFDPEREASLTAALARLVADAELRASLSEGAYARAGCYSWARCASETLAFLAEVAGG